MRTLLGSIVFATSLLQQWGVGAPTPSSSPYLLPSVMTSLHSGSSRTTLADSELEGDRDLEAFDKVEGASAKGNDNTSEKGPSPWEVTLDKSEDPKTVATWRKWAILLTVSAGAMCVTSASSMVRVT